MAAKERYEVAYRTAPKWMIPATMAACALAALCIVFSSYPLGMLIVPHASVAYIVMEIAVRLGLVLMLSIVAFMSHEVFRNERLVISRDGIEFPFLISHDLLFRRKRQWDDIGNILIGAMLLQDRKGTYEYELENTKDRRKMFMYFKSGGHAALDLNRVQKSGHDKLFQAIEKWCIDCQRSPQQHAEIARERAAKEAKYLSYTQMWEDQLRAHFSATNFVPLDKGRTLRDGRLSVVMQLSCGGFSGVYLAESDGKDLVVIKEATLPPDVAESTRIKAKELFTREALLLMKLSHPSIARVLDSFLENGRDYLVLEFVPGENLRQIVKKKGVQSENAVLNYARQAAVILDYLHDQDPPIVHRDITPDNFILKEDGQLVLIDFGAANSLVGTATVTLIGKQAYMSPEQFRGKATCQSDLYSLGGTLFFLLTGLDPEALSASHPQEKRGEVSDEMDSLIFALTQIDLPKRLGSANELIERIDAMLPDTMLKL